jgi:hypothetical protein
MPQKYGAQDNLGAADVTRKPSPAVMWLRGITFVSFWVRRRVRAACERVISGFVHPTER